MTVKDGATRVASWVITVLLSVGAALLAAAFAVWAGKLLWRLILS